MKRMNSIFNVYFELKDMLEKFRLTDVQLDASGSGTAYVTTPDGIHQYIVSDMKPYLIEIPDGI